jgi:hypothetical protein
MVRIERHALLIAAGERASIAMLAVMTSPTHRHQTIERRKRRTAVADGDDMID